MQVKLVLAMYLNYELFWMNNETIIEFGFRIIWRIMENSEGVIRDNTLLDLHIFHKILSLIH